MIDLFCNWKFVPFILFTHLHSCHPHPLASPKLSVSLGFCFFSPLDFTYKWYNAVVVFLWLFHLVWCPQDPSVLSQMARFHTFYGWIIVHCIYLPHFPYPFSHQWIFRLFLFLGYHKYCCCEHESTVFFFSLDKYLEVELLGHTAVLFLLFWGSSLLFSTVAALIYIFTNPAQDFHFLHILGNTCYFLCLW